MIYSCRPSMWTVQWHVASRPIYRVL